jgi:hypothetical protein
MTVQNASSAPQAHTTENAATGPLSTDDLTDVQNRARALQDELSAFYGESQRRAHQTFLLCCAAFGLLALAAGVYAGWAVAPRRPWFLGTCCPGWAAWVRSAWRSTQ